MPNIKPISDLKNSIEEQERQQAKAEEYDRTAAQLKLMCELNAGRKSGEKDGWISTNDVRSHFLLSYTDK